MERRRWMRDDLGSVLCLRKPGGSEPESGSSNGKTIHTTRRLSSANPITRHPCFQTTLEYVEINPFWNVPYSIATKEYLPKLKQNPSALSRARTSASSGTRATKSHRRRLPGIAIRGGNFPFRLRQDPGDGNALGRIKFMFPNEFNIYIHDTPSKIAFFAR